MSLDAKVLKGELRRRALRQRAALPAEQVAADGAILQQLLRLDAYRTADWVHTYVASKVGEVDTRGLLADAWSAGKATAVPVVQRRLLQLRHARLEAFDQLAKGPFGVLQPGAGHGDWLEDVSRLDLVVVPGLAFDAAGGRLGFGAGYYDRFLASVEAPKIGLVYQGMLLEGIPQEKHDIPMDVIITETQTIFCKESKP